MKKFKFLVLVLIFTCFVGMAADDLFEDMDAETQRKTGVEKLSESERLALTQWLNGDREEIIKKEKKKNMGLRKEESDRANIESSIVGDFNGWSGQNVFQLANGQIWKQVEMKTFYIPSRKNPNITIKPKSMGSWMLYVEGFGTGTKVKRIK